MNRLQILFDQKKKDLLNIYFTAGYPKLEATEKLIVSLDKAGADMVEVGMPYSDPLADGPTIQESGQVALANGMKLDLLFEQLERARAETEIPVILMGYFNQLMQYGVERFLRRCKAVGVDGLILPDLPMEIYEEDYQALFEELDLYIIFLITPQTPEARIRKVDSLSKGFIYMVSNSSITGAKSGISEQQLGYFTRVEKMALQNPRLIGFGISDNETFQTACQYAAGAIIGSAFIKALKDSADVEKTTFEFVSRIKNVAIEA